LVAVLREFGFDVPELTADLFIQENRVVRLGVPPVRIEIITTISGVTFDECYAKRVTDELGISFLVTCPSHTRYLQEICCER